MVTAQRSQRISTSPTAPLIPTAKPLGLESRHLESRAKAEARLDLEVSAGWASLSTRGMWGGDALLLFHQLLNTETLRSQRERNETETRALLRRAPASGDRAVPRGDSPRGVYQAQLKLTLPYAPSRHALTLSPLTHTRRHVGTPQCGSYVDIQPTEAPPWPPAPALPVLELLDGKAVEVQVSEWSCREAEQGGIPESARELSLIYPAGRVCEVQAFFDHMDQL